MAGLGWMKNVLRALWVTVNNLYVIPAHVVWMVVLYPVSLVLGESAYLRQGFLFGVFLGPILGSAASP